MRVDALGIDFWRGDKRFSQHRRDAPDDPRAGQKHDGRGSELDDAGDPTYQVDLRESEVGDNRRGEEKKKRQRQAQQRLAERPRVVTPSRQTRYRRTKSAPQPRRRKNAIHFQTDC